MLALARGAREGLHRDPRRPAISPEESAEHARTNKQDAALLIIAAVAGLRLGELLALRRRNVKLADAKLTVEASCAAP